MGLKIVVVGYNYIHACRAIGALAFPNRPEVKARYNSFLLDIHGDLLIAISEYTARTELNYIDQIIIVDEHLWDPYSVQEGLMDKLLNALEYSCVPYSYQIQHFRMEEYKRPLQIAVVANSFEESRRILYKLAEESGVKIQKVTNNSIELSNGIKYIVFSNPTSARGHRVDQILLIPHEIWDIRVIQADLINSLLATASDRIPSEMKIVEYKIPKEKKSI